VNHAKTADAIEMPFGLVGGVGLRNIGWDPVTISEKVLLGLSLGYCKGLAKTFRMQQIAFLYLLPSLHWAGGDV